MENKNYLQFTKYYKGEKSCPFARDSRDAGMWYAEKSLLDYPEGISHALDMLDDTLERGLMEGNFIKNSKIPKERRAIALYTYLFYCKWHPYESDFPIEEII